MYRKILNKIVSIKFDKTEIFLLGILAGVLILGIVIEYRIIDKIKDEYYEFKAHYLYEILETEQSKEKNVHIIEMDYDGTAV